MPYLSLLFVVLAMVWSWSWASGPKSPLGGGQLSTNQLGANQLGTNQLSPEQKPSQGVEATKISEAIHTGLQDDLQHFLTLYARRYLQASQVQVQNLSTQHLGEGKIEATFELHYVDSAGDALQHRGQADLHRHSQRVWQLRGLQLHNKAIEFNDEILIEVK